MIRKFIEEAESVQGANQERLDDLRTLAEKHWPWLLSKLPHAPSTKRNSSSRPTLTAWRVKIGKGPTNDLLLYLIF